MFAMDIAINENEKIKILLRKSTTDVEVNENEITRKLEEYY